jgi:hypothetical protein
MARVTVQISGVKSACETECLTAVMPVAWTGGHVADFGLGYAVGFSVACFANRGQSFTRAPGVIAEQVAAELLHRATNDPAVRTYRR